MTYAVACVALAVFAIFASHVVSVWREAKREAWRREEIEKTRKELSDEIFGGGNVARICALRRRLLELAER